MVGVVDSELHTKEIKDLLLFLECFHLVNYLLARASIGQSICDCFHELGSSLGISEELRTLFLGFICLDCWVWFLYFLIHVGLFDYWRTLVAFQDNCFRFLLV